MLVKLCDHCLNPITTPRLKLELVLMQDGLRERSFDICTDCYEKLKKFFDDGIDNKRKELGCCDD